MKSKTWDQSNENFVLKLNFHLSALASEDFKI